MADEMRNQNQSESNSYNESIVQQENIAASENQVINEVSRENEVSDDSNHEETQESKRRNILSLMTGSLVTVVAAAVVGVTGLLNVSMSASFEDVIYQDGNIHYVINVDGMTEKEKLTTYVELDGKQIELISITDEDSDGKVEGDFAVDMDYVKEKLDSGDKKVEYRFTLKGMVGLDVERAFDSYVVKIEEVTSTFTDVDMWCNCGVDGYYYFKMNFVDDFGLFSNFQASIRDASGNVSYCTFEDDLHAEQRIYVADLSGMKGTLEIKYDANGSSVEPLTYNVTF
ncbi:MAG: hypothetical protein MJ228_02810 [Bacilli bacterium]|nr:hypothetical protein [Bacilli bacterium]